MGIVFQTMVSALTVPIGRDVAPPMLDSHDVKVGKFNMRRAMSRDVRIL